MSKDALKFFQSYIEEMVDIGGKNLPKSVSTKLGAKLGKIYKKKRIKDFSSAVKKSFKVLGAKTKIVKLNENKYEIKVKHKHKFCPIGGKYSPEKAEFVQKTICVPFYIGFLNELNPEIKYNITVQKCIVNSHTNLCKFLLFPEKKDKVKID
ncbi:MAG: hypothetical protein EU540_06470 [Promethearchaeota archaeon]|nr:MAG: hypothetical protein EU540_06470 [Candidatus Lokiarchaeota archaeon]